MTSVAERLTADAYLARDEPRRTELIDGAVVVNEPSVPHQRVVGLIYEALASWTRGDDGRGSASLPINVPLDDANVLAPDVLWFAEPLDLSAAVALELGARDALRSALLPGFVAVVGDLIPAASVRGPD